MPSNIKAHGVDLDSIFLSGSGGSATGILTGAADLNTRFAPYTSGTKATLTGILVGAADLNARFAPAVSTPLTGSLSTGSTTASGTGAGPFTTPSVTATAAGGTGPYTYAWTLATGSGISATTSTTAATTFSATPGIAASVTATFICTITDAASHTVVTSPVAITINSTSTVATITVSPNGGTYTADSINAGTFGGDFTINNTGGVGPFTYAWVRNSGTYFSSANVTTAALHLFHPYTVGESSSGTESWTATQTDTGNSSATATATISVSLSVSSSAVPLAVTINPNSYSNTVDTKFSGGLVEAVFTAVPANGVAPFTYVWTRTTGIGWTGGGSGNTLTLDKFYSQHEVRGLGETWRVVVTDALGATANASVTANLDLIDSTTAASVAVSPHGGGFSSNSDLSAGTFSRTFTAAVSGGTGPFTYSWVRTSGTAILNYAGATTNALTLSKSYARHALFTASETWTVTATDTGMSGATCTDTISVDWECVDNR